MGISIDAVHGEGIVIYLPQEKNKLISLIKHINPNFILQSEDDLEVCLFEEGLLDTHLTFNYVGNTVTGKDAGIFIKILSEHGENILKSFGEPIKEINTICIM